MAKKVLSVEARAKKRGINLSKVVRQDLPFDGGDAWAMYQTLHAFFQEHGVKHGNLDIEYYGYDGGIENLSVSATVTKTQQELEAEIRADDAAKAVAAAKAKKEREKADAKAYADYLQLHERFGNKK